HLGHPLLPCLIADQSNTVDFGAMGRRELYVVPEGMQVPPVEIVELRQQADFPVLGDRGVNRRHEMLVVFVVELAAQPEANDVRTAGFELLDHGCASFAWSLLSGEITPSYRSPSVYQGLPSPLRPSRTL